MNEIDLLNKIILILSRVVAEINDLKDMIWENYNNENRN